MVHFYRKPALTESRIHARMEQFPSITGMESEFCYNVGVSGELSASETDTLRWLLSETFEPESFSDKPFLTGGDVIEAGPRMNFQTAWSTNAVSVCHAVGLTKVLRLERSLRVLAHGLGPGEREAFSATLFDRMTECIYPTPLTSFATGAKPEPVRTVDVLGMGRDAIVAINREMGLGLDSWDIDYYTDLFVNRMRKNPTNVECFDLGQSNSEHSRHWFFKGRLVIDGVEMPQSLLEIVAGPLNKSRGRSVIAFGDNSSSIRGCTLNTIRPPKPGEPGALEIAAQDADVIFTAETHNFPSGVAPFPGAETGTGGRIRDVQGVGRGGLVIAGTAAYCVGNLRIPGYEQPWEPPQGVFDYPSNLASPLTIEIEASNGASDYGNKFGEPLIQGYTRSFGMRLPGGERREWIKPIMFTGGIGQMLHSHAKKGSPGRGMLITKVGGPAYRIGMGGGAASSMVQGENAEELDFNAVQRGDAEMEQKMNRVIRACVEMGDRNPIVSIHDQGAGGNCNVLKELIEPEGGRIDIRQIPLGDETLSVLEIWGAEYQENNALLIRPEHAALFSALCEREKVPHAFVGEVAGDGRVVVHDSRDGSTPVDLDLKMVLAEMPRKTFEIRRSAPALKPLELPAGLSVRDALDRVLRLVSVGSKRFLINKVDRSVTGLIAAQQGAGPLHLTVGDVACVAQSHFPLADGTYPGAATAIGEQPLKGLINPAAMARMSVAEALTNLVWARVSALCDVRCSANWMWAAKLPGEGALVYDAALAMGELMSAMGIAVDGGKDSLSMASVDRATGEVVKAPGALVISAYAPMPDVRAHVTPDLKHPDTGTLIYIDLGNGKYRTGGSALAQVYAQVGDSSPDVDNPATIVATFETIQELIARGLISAGHDRSDGGLVTALLEMAFAGNAGLDVDMAAPAGLSALDVLFSEEAGLVIECSADARGEVMQALQARGVPHAAIGRATKERRIRIAVNGSAALDEDMIKLRALWEATSLELEKLQSNPDSARQENGNIREREAPAYGVSFGPLSVPGGRVRVAIVREEGSNGDREMASAFHAAGFEPWDVTVTDVMHGRVTLDRFRGVVFVGGFSYADVLDSAKGWAGAIRFNSTLAAQFGRFHDRSDTFSLGICNGCQLMALLGWVPFRGLADTAQPRFVHNASGRFESRFSTVTIMKSPSVMLRGMEGSTLGVWVAHGEGRAHFPDRAIYDRVMAGSLAPVRFADDRGAATQAYPFNPNGSPEGIAGLCSPDGRHLALMPHPERAFLKWQWPWMPAGMRASRFSAEVEEASPWLRMFVNARAWCMGL